MHEQKNERLAGMSFQILGLSEEHLKTETALIQLLGGTVSSDGEFLLCTPSHYERCLTQNDQIFKRLYNLNFALDSWTNPTMPIIKEYKFYRDPIADLLKGWSFQLVGLGDDHEESLTQVVQIMGGKVTAISNVQLCFPSYFERRRELNERRSLKWLYDIQFLNDALERQTLPNLALYRFWREEEVVDSSNSAQVLDGWSVDLKGFPEEDHCTYSLLLKALGAKIYPDADIIFCSSSYYNQHKNNGTEIALYKIDFVKDSAKNRRLANLNEYRWSNSSTLETMALPHVSTGTGCSSLQVASVVQTTRGNSTPNRTNARIDTLNVSQINQQSDQNDLPQQEASLTDGARSQDHQYPAIHNLNDHGPGNSALQISPASYNIMLRQVVEEFGERMNIRFCPNRARRSSRRTSRRLSRRSLPREDENAEHLPEASDETPRSSIANETIDEEYIAESFEDYFPGDGKWWETREIPMDRRCMKINCTFEPGPHPQHPEDTGTMTMIEKGILLKYLITRKCIGSARSGKTYKRMIANGYLSHKGFECLRSSFRQSIVTHLELFKLPEKLRSRLWLQRNTKLCAQCRIIGECHR